MEERRVLEPIIRVRRHWRYGAKSGWKQGYSVIWDHTSEEYWSCVIRWRVSRAEGRARPLRKGRPTEVLGEPSLNLLRRLELRNNHNNMMMMDAAAQATTEPIPHAPASSTIPPQARGPQAPRAGGRTWYDQEAAPWRPDIWSIERAWAQVAAEQYHRWKPKA